MGYRVVSIVSRWRVLDVSLRFDDGSGDLDVDEIMLYSFVEIRYTGKVFSFLDLVNVFKCWFFFSRYFISESYPWFVSFGFCLIILWAILCVVSCDEIFILFPIDRSYNAATIFSNLRLKFFPKISHDSIAISLINQWSPFTFPKIPLISDNLRNPFPVSGQSWGKSNYIIMFEGNTGSICSVAVACNPGRRKIEAEMERDAKMTAFPGIGFRWRVVAIRKVNATWAKGGTCG